jgi:hypothetical protein
MQNESKQLSLGKNFSFSRILKRCNSEAESFCFDDSIPSKDSLEIESVDCGGLKSTDFLNDGLRLQDIYPI